MDTPETDQNGYFNRFDVSPERLKHLKAVVRGEVEKPTPPVDTDPIDDEALASDSTDDSPAS